MPVVRFAPFPYGPNGLKGRAVALHGDVATRPERPDAEIDRRADLDVLFSQERPSAAALELGIEIHQALEPESQNFWLTAWLRNQVDVLGERLKQL